MLVKPIGSSMRSALTSIYCLTTAGAFILAACAPASHPKQPIPAGPTKPRLVGEVAVVDEEKRFVLIDLESNLYVPAPGTALRATNRSDKTAHLKASPEQKRPFIAADIIDGDPIVGDQVFR